MQDVPIQPITQQRLMRERVGALHSGAWAEGCIWHPGGRDGRVKPGGWASARQLLERQAEELTEVLSRCLGPHGIHRLCRVALGVPEVDKRRHGVPTTIAHPRGCRDQAILQLEENPFGGFPADPWSALQPGQVTGVDDVGQLVSGQG